MSVPGVFAPTELDGQILGDGMLVDNLPVDVARAMGADVLIAVNIGAALAGRETLSSVGGLTAQMLSILTEQNVQRSLALLGPKDVLLAPELGALSAGDFDKTAELIQLGEAVSAPQLQQLAGLSLDESSYRQWQAAHQPPAAEPVRLAVIKFAGTQVTNPERFADQLKSVVGEPFDEDKAEHDAQQLAASGDYARSDFRLMRTPEGEGLLFDLEEKPWGPHYFRVGLDLFTDFSGDSAFNIKVTHTRRWLDASGTEWHNFVQIGQTPTLYSELRHPLSLLKGLSSDLFVAGYAEIQWRQFTLYDNDSGDQLGRFSRGSGRVGLDIGQPWGRFGEVRLGLTQAVTRVSPELISDEYVGPTDSSTLRDTGVRLMAVLDQLDYVNFPTRGYRVEASALIGRRTVSSPSTSENFTRLEFDGTSAISWGNTTLDTRLLAQSSGGKDSTNIDQYSYTLGGFHRLSGYQQDQLTGSEVLYGRLMAYHRLDTSPLLTRGFFMGASLEAGNAWFGQDGMTLSDMRLGSSLFVGADTALGPLYLGITYAPRGQTALYLYLGRP
jgi:NTE family protein